MTTTQLHDPLRADAARPLNPPAIGAALVVFLFAFACFLPLPAGDPLAATEGHRALTAHEMVTSGEWIVPRMFGRVYLAKPPLHYWIIGAFEKISGRATPFVWRLPSTVIAALTAAMLTLFASQWFGRTAGWVSGISFIAMVPLWGQNRGADIDVTNTLAANLAALCILELHFANPRRKASWISGAGAAIGAAWLTKGPAGMTMVLGAMASAIALVSVDAIRQRKASALLAPTLWLPLLIGIAIFLAWVIACGWYLKSHGMPIDWTGVTEGTQDLHPHDWSWKRAFEWFFFPVTMFLCALPASLGLPMLLFRDVRDPDPQRWRLMQALAATVLFAWGVCFVSGMHLSRYGYVTLPLLSPLAGAVTTRALVEGSRFRSWVRVAAFWIVCCFGGAVLVVSGLLWRHAEMRPSLLMTAILAALIATVAACLLAKRDGGWRAMWSVPVLLILLSNGIGGFAHFNRIKRSSIGPAKWIRGQTGPDAELVTCAMILDQPELFYYSGLPTRATNGNVLDWRPLKSGTWVVLEEPELKVWRANVPDRLSKVLPFRANDNTGFLVLYALPPSGASK